METLTVSLHFVTIVRGFPHSLGLAVDVVMLAGGHCMSSLETEIK